MTTQILIRTYSDAIIILTMMLVMMTHSPACQVTCPIEVARLHGKVLPSLAVVPSFTGVGGEQWSWEPEKPRKHEVFEGEATEIPQNHLGRFACERAKKCRRHLFSTESMTKHLSVWAMIGMDASIWTSLTFLDFCERRNVKVCVDRKTAPWNVRISRPQPNIETCSMPLLAKNITYTNCILLMQYNNFRKSPHPNHFCIFSTHFGKPDAFFTTDFSVRLTLHPGGSSPSKKPKIASFVKGDELWVKNQSRKWPQNFSKSAWFIVSHGEM